MRDNIDSKQILSAQFLVARRDKHLSVLDLAELAGVDPDDIVKLESGQCSNLSIDFLDRIANALDVTMGINLISNLTHDSVGMSDPANVYLALKQHGVKDDICGRDAVTFISYSMLGKYSDLVNNFAQDGWKVLKKELIAKFDNDELFLCHNSFLDDPSDSNESKILFDPVKASCFVDKMASIYAELMGYIRRVAIPAFYHQIPRQDAAKIAQTMLDIKSGGISPYTITKELVIITNDFPDLKLFIDTYDNYHPDDPTLYRDIDMDKYIPDPDV